MYIKKNSNIFLTGHNGMLGKSLHKTLKENGYSRVIVRDKKKLNLCDNNALKNFFQKNKIDCVINTAGKVGGIISNNKLPADYIIENTLINTNLILLSHRFNINKFINIGSSCIYPKKNKIPIKESYLLSSQLEKTNEYYAISKIHALKLCEALNKQYGRKYFSIMPTNLYGPNDKFDIFESHVIPALILKFFNAKLKNKKTVKIIGDGSSKRDFLFVNELSDAILKLLSTSETKLFKIFKKNSLFHLNIGSSSEYSIKQLIKIICKELNYKGEIKFDKNKVYNGTVRKKLDNSIIHKLGWNNKTSLKEGIKKTIIWYKNNL